MRIDTTENSVGLEKISEGDVLVFPDREETVEEVDTLRGSLHTKRIVKDQDKNFPFMEQLILYTHIGRVGPSSTGHAYDYIKRGTA